MRREREAAALLHPSAFGSYHGGMCYRSIWCQGRDEALSVPLHGVVRCRRAIISREPAAKPGRETRDARTTPRSIRNRGAVTAQTAPRSTSCAIGDCSFYGINMRT